MTRCSKPRTTTRQDLLGSAAAGWGLGSVARRDLFSRVEGGRVESWEGERLEVARLRASLGWERCTTVRGRGRSESKTLNSCIYTYSHYRAWEILTEARLRK